MAENKHAGEVPVTIAGKAMVLRPNFQAQCEAEALCGFGVVTLLNRFMQKQFGIREVAAVIYAGLKHGSEQGKNITYEAVGEKIALAGITSVTGAYGRFLENAVAGGQELKQGEAEAEA
jgi:hypothetical protein